MLMKQQKDRKGAGGGMMKGRRKKQGKKNTVTCDPNQINAFKNLQSEDILGIKNK